MTNNEKLTNKLYFLNLSFFTRAALQTILLISLLVIPYFNPDFIHFENPTPVIFNVIFSLFINIVFEIIKKSKEVKKSAHLSVLNIQVVTNSVLLLWFLHMIGRINGPFFILLPLFIIESAYVSGVQVQNAVFAVVFLSTLVEYFWIGLKGEITFDIFSLMLLGVRLIAIYLMKSYASETHEKLDIEEKTTQSLSSMNTKLKDIDKNKDEFIYMAAHELRTPLTAIKGYVSMVLEGDAGEIPAKARGFLADVNNINDRLIRLLNNMLNVSKIEEGKLVYQVEKENLSEITRAVFNQFIPETERKKLKYTLEIPRRLKDRVSVDSDRVQEVMGNIISNAVKYTDTGSVIVRLKRGDNDKDRVRFEVEDTGPGISNEEQKKLFQKFYRVESNVGKTTGSGLGLYISKLIIEKFNGNIGIESKTDQGSTFWFDLPLVS